MVNVQYVWWFITSINVKYFTINVEALQNISFVDILTKYSNSSILTLFR